MASNGNSRNACRRIVSSCVRQTYNITVTNDFDLKNSTSMGESIKFRIDTLKQHEDMTWLPSRRPGCESGDVGKHDGSLWEKIYIIFKAGKHGKK